MILGDLPQFFKFRVVASSKILTRAEEVPELVLFALEARTGAAVDARDHVEHVGWMMGLRCPEETAFSILTKNFHVRRHCCSRLRPPQNRTYFISINEIEGESKEGDS